MIYVDLFADLVSNVDAKITPALTLYDSTITSVNYYFGPPIQVEQQLQAWNDNNAQKKYPVIALLQSFKERKDTGIGIDGIPLITLIIARQSEPDWLTPQRYDVNFRPVLQPIYEALISVMKSDKRINSPGLLPHDKTDWPFWTNGKDTNPFKDKLDVIEVNFSNLNIKQKNC